MPWITCPVIHRFICIFVHICTFKPGAQAGQAYIRMHAYFTCESYGRSAHSRMVEKKPTRLADRAAQELVEVLDSQLFTALAEPVRIELLKELILCGRADVATLASKLPQHQSVISRHLLVLFNAGILKRAKEQRHVYYELDGDYCVRTFKSILARVEKAVQVCCPD